MRIRIGRARGGVRSGRVVSMMERVLVQTAIEVADELAEATGPSSKQSGDRAVVGDVESVFPSPGRVANLLRKEDRGKAAAWLQAIDEGAGAGRLEQLLKGTALQGVPVVNAPDKQEHVACLRSGHRRRGRPLALVRSYERHARFFVARLPREANPSVRASSRSCRIRV